MAARKTQNSDRRGDNRAVLARSAVIALALAALLAAAPTAAAAPRLLTTRTLPVVFNQGIAVESATGLVFFAGATSERNSGLFRTTTGLRRTGARIDAIPRNARGYNHIGDITYHAAGRRLLLPLECYDPRSRANTCRRGALGVADPRTLRMRYLIELDPGQIAKAMWVEVSPDGRWTFTSSGRNLIAYPSAAINRATAAAQRAGRAGALRGRDLGPVLPTSAVTGAAASWNRLYLSLNRGRLLQVISYPLGASGPAGPPRVDLSITQTPLNGEPEGLAATTTRAGAVRLHWQMIPTEGFFTRLLTYGL